MRAILLTLIFAALACAAAPQYYACFLDGVVPRVEKSDGVAGLAYGYYNESVDDIGRGSLYIHTTDGDKAENSIYCAGVLESYLTHERISQHYRMFYWANLENFTAAETQRLNDYLTINQDWVVSMVDANPTDPYWQHIHLLMRQIDGLNDGYSKYAAAGDVPLTRLDFVKLNSAGDLDDLASIITQNLWNDTKNANLKANLEPHSFEWYETHHHCTGLVKIPPDFSDIYFAQDTWSTFADLHRMTKYYDFEINKDNAGFDVASAAWTISSSPGVIVSLDDLWVLDSQLLVLETTMNNFNMSLYQEYCNPKQVLCWQRVSTANRLASSGAEWVQIFPKYNSGTYNNQYFVLDLKLFKPFDKPLKPGLLWTIEMFPGPYVRTLDRTAELEVNTYVPSINVPLHRDLFDIAGYPMMIEREQNNYWSYWKCARMLLIKKYQGSITNYEEFKAFMRYNNYKVDPESHRDAAESILSRYDQRPAACIQLNNSRMCPNTFGGLDSKTTNFGLGKYLLGFDIHVSPTTDNGIPPWKFGVEPWQDVPYYGLPQLWNFEAGTMLTDDGRDLCQRHSNCTTCLSDWGCGWCSTSNQCMYGNANGPTIAQCVSAGWRWNSCTPGILGISWYWIVIIVVGSLGGVGAFTYVWLKRRGTFTVVHRTEPNYHAVGV